MSRLDHLAAGLFVLVVVASALVAMTRDKCYYVRVYLGEAFALGDRCR